MMRAIKYARKSGTPYFGICLGMQTACIEFARDACGLRDADSTEFNEETPFPVIFKLRDLVDVEEYGGTMRLGEWHCDVERRLARPRGLSRQRTRSANATVIDTNSIRHIANVLEKEGLVFSGVSPDGKFVEMVELPRESIRTSSRASSIRNTNQSRSLLIRCSIRSSKPPGQNRLQSENLEHDVTSDKQVEMP